MEGALKQQRAAFLDSEKEYHGTRLERGLVRHIPRHFSAGFSTSYIRFVDVHSKHLAW